LGEPDPLLEEALGVVEHTPDAIPTIVGPTATGKTGLAVRLAEAIGGEIVGVDSVQIYRHFDAGSGKPSAEELRRAPHHMLDVIDPLEAIDAAQFASMAQATIERIAARGKRPILCGGTFLWVKATLFGLAQAPGADSDLRAAHRRVVEERGRLALHAELARLDPLAAAKLHPNDVVRVSRALEVIELTGKSLLAWQADHAFRSPKHRAVFMAIRRSPDDLSNRIVERVRHFLASGWIGEVHDLCARGYRDARAMGSVGYREVRAHVVGELSAEELERAIVRSTRIFARRQRTWLNHEPVTWLGRT
jgi:tRNA dimethylallyltransferase